MIISLKLPFSFKNETLATGSELRSSFAVLSKDTVFISEPYSDLREPKVFEAFKKNISKRKKKQAFGARIIGCDLHPEYLSTKYAKEIFEDAKRSVAAIYEDVNSQVKEQTGKLRQAWLETIEEKLDLEGRVEDLEKEVSDLQSQLEEVAG